MASGLTAQRSNPGKEGIFYTRPEWLLGSQGPLYNGYQVIPEGKVAVVWR